MKVVIHGIYANIMHIILQVNLPLKVDSRMTKGCKNGLYQHQSLLYFITYYLYLGFLLLLL